MKIAILYGSIRSHRKGIRLARFLRQQLKERNHEVELVDPLDFDLPLLDLMYKEYDRGEAPEPMEQLADIVRDAEAYVFVSGEYNHGIPPALKNLIDHFMEEWFWKPAAIASYSAGSFGGVRAAIQLRSVLAEVGLVTVPRQLPVPRIADSFGEDGEPRDGDWRKRADRFLRDLEWYAGALAQARADGVPGS